MREMQASALGGLRALETYTQARFKATETSGPAFDAAVSFDQTRKNLYFYGPTGSGKSHLAAIAARKIIANPSWIKTATQMQIARAIRAAESANEEEKIIRGLVLTPILVLEDLGVAKDTEFSLTLLYEIINGRYQNRAGGLIVTSNLSLGEIASKIGDDRISSRLAQMCMIFSLKNEQDYRIARRPA